MTLDNLIETIKLEAKTSIETSKFYEGMEEAYTDVLRRLMDLKASEEKIIERGEKKGWTLDDSKVRYGYDLAKKEEVKEV